MISGMCAVGRKLVRVLLLSLAVACVTTGVSAQVIDDYIVETSNSEHISLRLGTPGTYSDEHSGIAGGLPLGLSIGTGSGFSSGNNISASTFRISNEGVFGNPIASTEYTANYTGRFPSGSLTGHLSLDVQFDFEILIGVVLSLSFDNFDTVQVLYTPDQPGALEQVLFENTGDPGDFLSENLGLGSLSILGSKEIEVNPPAPPLASFLLAASELDFELTGVPEPTGLALIGLPLLILANRRLR